MLTTNHIPRTSNYLLFIRQDHVRFRHAEFFLEVDLAADRTLTYVSTHDGPTVSFDSQRELDTVMQLADMAAHDCTPPRAWIRYNRARNSAQALSNSRLVEVEL